MTRREERIEAFKIIFQNIFTEKDYIYENDIKLTEFTAKLVSTVEENKDALLNEISDKISKKVFLVDLAIILVAYAEAKFEISPKEVAVNEAVEIAKLYSTDESPAFINAVLKAIIK